MDTKHRFSVKKVSESGQFAHDNVMQGVPENEMLELEDSPGDLAGVAPNTYPVNDPKQRRRSLAQLTREALPRADHYRYGLSAMKRPSLGELHGEPIEIKVSLLALILQLYYREIKLCY